MSSGGGPNRHGLRCFPQCTCRNQLPRRGIHQDKLGTRRLSTCHALTLRTTSGGVVLVRAGEVRWGGSGMSRPIETVLNKLLPPTQIVFKGAVYGTDCEKANHHKKDLVRSQSSRMKTGDVHIWKMMSGDPNSASAGFGIHAVSFEDGQNQRGGKYRVCKT